MRAVSFELATLIPESAVNSKNFNELLQYIELMGFHAAFVHTHKDERIILRAGKKSSTILEVIEVFVALHLFAAQRKQDLVVVGKFDGEKYQHRVFGTLSIQKLRHWTESLARQFLAQAA
jgi:hypothetical protein